ncbi:MAG: DUF1566 domain-containing protein [Chlorobiaceae bacterium]|nr:DUF1566 domain-containing protein [Chlorobiaceae bacterium]
MSLTDRKESRLTGRSGSLRSRNQSNRASRVIAMMLPLLLFGMLHAFRTGGAAPLAIGDAWGGGIVAYLFQPGDAGYVPGEQHGLIAARRDVTFIDTYGMDSPDTADKSYNSNMQSRGWFRWSTSPAGTNSDSFFYGKKVPTVELTGSGMANTRSILFVYPATIFKYTAAVMCDLYSVTDDGKTYDDWYLPSLHELRHLHENRKAIGGFTLIGYWSSSGNDSSTDAWYILFYDGLSYLDNKFHNFCVRPVRSF